MQAQTGAYARMIGTTGITSAYPADALGLSSAQFKASSSVSTLTTTKPPNSACPSLPDRRRCHKRWVVLKSENKFHHCFLLEGTIRQA